LNVRVDHSNTKSHLGRQHGQISGRIRLSRPAAEGMRGDNSGQVRNSLSDPTIVGDGAQNGRRR